VNTSVFHRRRAERFAQLLDEAGGARRHHVRSRDDRDLTDLVGVGHRLARIDFGVRADPEFKDGLRAMLMATIEREGIGATAIAAPEPEIQERPGWLPVRSRRARGAVVVGLAVGTLAVSGMSAASGDAMPGDTLYGVKRSTEKAQIAMAGSQVGRGQLYLEFAKTRMNEASAVRGDAPGLTAVLDDMDTETREGVKLLHTSAVDRRDAAALDVVDAFVRQQRDTMSGMIGGLTGGARTRAVGSLALLDTIQRRTAGLRGTLRCGDFTSMGVDEFGPRPGRCAAQGQLQPATGGGAKGGSPVTGQAGRTDGGTAATEAGPAPATRSGTATPSPTAGAAQAEQPQTPPGGAVTSPSTPEDSKHGDESIIDKIGHLLGG